MRWTDGRHFEYPTIQEFDTIVFREDARLNHPVILVDGETPRHRLASDGRNQCRREKRRRKVVNGAHVDRFAPQANAMKV
jgi:hypothetical protein